MALRRRNSRAIDHLLSSQGNNGTVCDVPVISTDFLRDYSEYAWVASPIIWRRWRGRAEHCPIVERKQGGSGQDCKKSHLLALAAFYSNHGAQSPGGAIRYEGYKLIEYYENNTVQLFNLKTDPGEQHDLAASEPGKVQELGACCTLGGKM